MLTEERHHEILDLLNRRGAVTVIELTKLLKTSESTIRRDLNALARIGKLNKVHGGATALERVMQDEQDMQVKSERFQREKEEIAQYAASLIRDGDFIYIDAGSTPDKLVDAINIINVTYVTNGINHARKLTQKGCKVYVIGGQFKPVTEAIIGAQALKSIETFNFTKCFLGTNGIDKICGYTTPDVEEGLVKAEAIKRSFVSFVLADHSKFDAVSAAVFGQLRQACIITDELPDPSYQDITVVKEVLK